MRKKIKKIVGFFFGSEKETSSTEKAEEMLKLYLKYIPEIKRVMRQVNNEEDGITDGALIGTMYDGITDGALIGTMYDFYVEVGGTTNTHLPPLLPAQGQNFLRYQEERTDAKPIDVQNEIEHIPTPFTLEKLDEKIELFKKKSRLIEQRYTKEQCDGFIKRLENRKHYQEHAAFFEMFPNTTDERIDKLLGKYKLEMNKSDLFVPVLPEQAINLMTEYKDVVAKITTEKPVFYVIAEEKDFAEKRRKLDPILLVQSPFGFYWQILGAWDKEVLLLSEL